jgi:Omp85 superfamily domain
MNRSNRPRPVWRYLAAALAGALTCVAAMAQSDSGTTATSSAPRVEEPAKESLLTRQEKSPWLFVPLVSSNPKLGTSLSLMGGYVWQLDPKSPASLVAVQGQRSSTDSTILALGGRFYFNGDRDRLEAALMQGRIKNDYEDFLGSGVRIRTNETVDALWSRYQRRVAPAWFVGGQFLSGNYQVSGADELSEQVIQDLALTGSRLVGLGAVATYDTRSNVNNPSEGLYAQLRNFAYRKGLGSEDSFDTVQGDLRSYLPLRPDNVLVLRASGGWTWDAPRSRQMSVGMRGYTRGQYLGRHVFTLEAEDRHMLQPKLGLKVFGGVSCLYGDGRSCSDQANLFPMLGGGAFYIIKPQQNMLISAELAWGKRGNQGLYLRFGQPF